MDKKLAVWLFMHGFAPTAKDGLKVLGEVRAGKVSEGTLAFFERSMDARMALGKAITAENVTEFLGEKLKTAGRLIAFWEENPKDTNAIFFFKKLNQVMWE